MEQIAAHRGGCSFTMMLAFTGWSASSMRRLGGEIPARGPGIVALGSRVAEEILGVAAADRVVR
jgi:hypothetical protein